MRRAGEDFDRLVPQVLAKFDSEAALAHQLHTEIAALDYALAHAGALAGQPEKFGGGAVDAADIMREGGTYGVLAEAANEITQVLSGYEADTRAALQLKALGGRDDEAADAGDKDPAMALLDYHRVRPDVRVAYAIRPVARDPARLRDALLSALEHWEKVAKSDTSINVLGWQPQQHARATLHELAHNPAAFNVFNALLNQTIHVGGQGTIGKKVREHLFVELFFDNPLLDRDLGKAMARARCLRGPSTWAESESFTVQPFWRMALTYEAWSQLTDGI